MTGMISKQAAIVAVERYTKWGDCDSENAIAAIRALPDAIAAINAIPDAPMDGVELQRFGFMLDGYPHTFLITHKFLPLPRPDGYWTPWHVAATALIAMQAEIAELRGKLINLSCVGVG